MLDTGLTISTVIAGDVFIATSANSARLPVGIALSGTIQLFGKYNAIKVLLRDVTKQSRCCIRGISRWRHLIH